MNLDRQLRAALSQEAEMQNAPTPDVEQLITGGRNRQRRERRRRLVRVGVAAAVAVLVAGGVYGVRTVDPRTTNEPSGTLFTTTPHPYRDDGHGHLPGIYRMLVGVDDTGNPINADFTFYDTWQGGGYPTYFSDTGSVPSFGGLAVYQPLALAAGSGCLSDQPNSDVGQTPRKLANQLAQLPRSTLVQSPEKTRSFGHAAYHLRLRINTNCGASIYRVAETLRGGHGISYDGDARVLIDFTVVNLGGGPTVVEMWHQDDAPSQMVDQITRSRNSVTFVTG